MQGLINFYRSTVGKKITMAVTGLVLVGFVLGHMAGNLKMFGGIHPDTGRYAVDEYAEALREIGAQFLGHETFLWIARAVLLGCLVLHVMSALWLARYNAAAKPIAPHGIKYRSANAASLTMRYGGMFLFIFVIFHLLHFTTGHVHTSGFVEGQVYSNVWLGFQSPLVTGFYILAMAFLSLHLYHGFWSMFQTLGVTTPAWNGLLKTSAKGIAVLLFVGFSSVPVAASLGILGPPVTKLASQQVQAGH